MTVNFARSCADIEHLKQVLQNIDAQSCPTCFNFHMHTVYSDGKLQPGKLMEQAIAIGLKGLAITDHHSIEDTNLLKNGWRTGSGIAKVQMLLTSGVE